MSTQAGAIFVKVELDESSFDSGLNSLNTKVEKSGGFLSQALSFATGGAILGGLSAIKDSIGGIASKMIDGNAQFETYETQFGVLLGSAEEAKTRLAELAAFGASTPFELPELVQADKVLTSFGIHSQDMLTIVGDVAAGTGASFQDMALLMGKFSAGATGEVISRFAELGIASRAELANLGLEFSKSGELLSPLPQSMEVVQNLMKEKFGGMMDAQSKTFDGMMSNLQDWVGGTLRTVGQPIFEVVKDKLGVLLEFLNSDTVKNTIDGFATGLAEGIGRAIEFIGGTIGTVRSGVQSFLQLFEGGAAAGAINIFYKILPPELAGQLTEGLLIVREAFSTAMEIIGRGNDILSTTINLLYAFLPPELAAQITGALLVVRDTALSLWQDLQTAFSDGGIQSAIGFLADKLAEVSPQFAILKATVEAALPPVQQIVTDVFNIITGVVGDNKDSTIGFVQETWSTVRGIIDALIPPIQAIVSTIFGAVATFIHTHGDDIRGFINTAWTAIQTIIKTALELIQATVVPLLQGIAAFIVAHKDQIIAVLEGAWNIIKGVITVALSIIQGVIATVLAVVRGDWEGAWNAIKTMFQGVWDGIKLILSGALEIIKNSLEMAWGAIKGVAETAWNYIKINIIQAAWDGIKSTIQSAIDGVKSSIETGFNGVKSYIQGIVDDIRGIFNGLVDNMSSVGSNIVEGIKSGIRDSWSSFVNWVTGQLSGLKDEILSFFGIDSPSTVMAYEVGKPLVQGILMGMRDALPNLLQFVGDMADDMLKTITDATKQINNLIVNSMDAMASLDRQQIANIRELNKLDPAVQSSIERTLDRALEESKKISDPAEQAKFFAMRSKQIFEAEKLRQELVDAQTAGDTTGAQRISEAISLLQDAQKAEQAAFKERMEQQKSAYEDMALKMADALSKAFDPVMAELLRKFLELTGLAGTILVPPAPLGSQGLMSLAQTSVRNGGTVTNNFNLTLNTDNVAPLTQEFAQMQALVAAY